MSKDVLLSESKLGITVIIKELSSNFQGKYMAKNMYKHS